ncbi:hypothetical protein C1646_725741, partial [Rhizophagus diaphanus]
MIFTVYVTDFLYFYYTYRVPDMCNIVKYYTHISHILYIYQVPNMYPIVLILTSD